MSTGRGMARRLVRLLAAAWLGLVMAFIVVAGLVMVTATVADVLRLMRDPPSRLALGGIAGVFAALAAGAWLTRKALDVFGG
jgi:hypothetical protein